MIRYDLLKQLDADISAARETLGQLRGDRTSTALDDINTDLMRSSRYVDNILAQYECAFCEQPVEVGEDGEDYYKGVKHFDCTSHTENRSVLDKP